MNSSNNTSIYGKGLCKQHTWRLIVNGVPKETSELTDSDKGYIVCIECKKTPEQIISGSNSGKNTSDY